MSYAAMPASSGGYIYAGFWWRVLASFIDTVVLFLLAALLNAVLNAVFVGPLMQTGQQDAAKHVILMISLFNFFTAVAYFVFFESSGLRATPGKLLCRLAVVDLDGRQISVWRSAGRYLGKYVSGLTLGIGFMMAGWTARKQTLQDKMAGCLVVRKTSFNRTDIRLPDFA
jgi:uncharacterized RDD family membrane protein YckC